MRYFVNIVFNHFILNDFPRMLSQHGMTQTSKYLGEIQLLGLVAAKNGTKYLMLAYLTIVSISLTIGTRLCKMIGIVKIFLL
jgi:hypothetical protein